MKLKKLLSIILTLCMLLSAMPFAVFAEGCAHVWECYEEEAPNCGYETVCAYQCTLCGENKFEYTPATGEHVDEDGDNWCEGCYNWLGCEMGEHVQWSPCTDDACAYCGVPLEVVPHEKSNYPCQVGTCLYYCGLEMPATADHSDEDGDNYCDTCWDWIGCDKGEHERMRPCTNDSCMYCGAPMELLPHQSNAPLCMDGTCRYGCGTAMPSVGGHEYAYDCSQNCLHCAALTRPEAGHVEGEPELDRQNESDHYLKYCCIYCSKLLSGGWEAHYDKDDTVGCDVCGYVDCDHAYDYDCSTTCNLCGWETRPEAACVEGDPVVQYTDPADHKLYYYCRYCDDWMDESPWEPHYDNDGVVGCDVCGYGACEHEYDYDCSATCNLCGQRTRPEAECVEGDPVPKFIYADEHKLYYYCRYCDDWMGESPYEAHYDNDGVVGCDVCGYGGCDHAYDYGCSTHCNICGVKTRPEAACVEADPVVQFSNNTNHKLYYNCVYCGTFLGESPWEAHYDEDGVDGCDVCGYGASAHAYDYDCSTHCNICGEETRPEADHAYDYGCSTTCRYCGEETRPEATHTYQYGCSTSCNLCGRYTRPEAEHAYDYDCSTNCNLCYCYTRPEADHVAGKPVPELIYDGGHKLFYYCQYCEYFMGEDFWAAHYDEDGIEGCDVCGYIPECEHDYLVDCSTTCRSCGKETRPEATHAYQYDCSTTCRYCGLATRPEAAHVAGQIEVSFSDATQHAYVMYCAYCTQFMEMNAGAHYDEDGVDGCDICGYAGCDHEYDYDCSTQCYLCRQITRPEAACVVGQIEVNYSDATQHSCTVYCAYCTRFMEMITGAHYDEDGVDGCDLCGYAGCDHAYDYDCSTQCNLCRQNTRPEAACVGGKFDVYYSDDTQHSCAVSCVYCGNIVGYDEGPHYDNDADGACDACGYAEAVCDHEYDYGCSSVCNLCGEETRPDAACVKGDPVPAYIYIDDHKLLYYCIYCNRYMDEDPYEDHYDNDGDCCCDACGHVVSVTDLDYVGASISEDVNGLAVAFKIQVQGVAFDGTRIDYTNATVGGYKLVGMGAVVSNNYESTNIIPTLENVDGAHVKDVPAVYAYEYDAATDTVYFAIRVINIPDTHKDTMLVYNPYYIFEDANGVQHVVYDSLARGARYNTVAEANAE